MQTLRLLMLLIMLMICTVDDINKKTVNIITVIVFGIAATVLNCGDLANGALLSAVSGIIPGALLLIISSFITGIGEGDGIVFMSLGINLGLPVCFEIMFISFVCAFIFGIFMLTMKRNDKEHTFAFVPFVLIAFCIYYMKEKYKSGSMTIELSLIMPGIMAIIFLIIFMGYFLHDKCVIKRAMYISVLREAELNSSKCNKSSIYECFEDNTDGKLLGTWQLDKTIQEEDGKVILNVKGVMASPLGFVSRYISNRPFSISMDAYSYEYRD